MNHSFDRVVRNAVRGHRTGSNICACLVLVPLSRSLYLALSLDLVRGVARRLSEIVLVNEIVGGAETAGYLLKYDSIHGTW